MRKKRGESLKITTILTKIRNKTEGATKETKDLPATPASIAGI